MKKPPPPLTDQTLRAENAELRARLEDAAEMLRAIRAGEVDALVVEGDAGPQLFTLQGVDAEQNRIRGNLQSVDAQSDYARRLLRTLDEQETRLEAIRRERAALDARASEQRDALRVTVR